MAWAKCSTHGPIQDASTDPRGLVCKCGLVCDDYEPEGFVEHDELKDLVKTHKQPKASKPKDDGQASG